MTSAIDEAAPAVGSSPRRLQHQRQGDAVLAALGQCRQRRDQRSQGAGGEAVRRVNMGQVSPRGECGVFTGKSMRGRHQRLGIGVPRLGEQRRGAPRSTWPWYSTSTSSHSCCTTARSWLISR